MAQYGITSAGFIRKPFSTIKDELATKARELFGDDIDLTVYSPVGLFVNLLSWNNNQIWQELEKSYYANWLDTAEGTNLERIVELGGIYRKQEQKAILYNVEFSGDDGTVIPKNFIIEDKNGIQFETAIQSTIGVTGGNISGLAILNCKAKKAGSLGAVEANTVTEIVNPLTGLDSVINPSASIGAADTETDAELRERYITEGAEGNGSSIDAIRTAVSGIENVKETVVYENTETGEVSGRPGKSVECVVLSDGSEDTYLLVAQTLFETKPAGIQTYGDIQRTITDSNGNNYQISFNEAQVVNILVQLDLVLIDGIWKDEYRDQIRRNVIEYIGGVFLQQVDGEDEEVYFRGLSINEDVFSWRIAAVNNSIPGIESIDVLIAIEGGTPASVSKLEIGEREIARCDAEDIVINPPEA